MAATAIGGCPTHVSRARGLAKEVTGGGARSAGKRDILGAKSLPSFFTCKEATSSSSRAQNGYGSRAGALSMCRSLSTADAKRRKRELTSWRRSSVLGKGLEAVSQRGARANLRRAATVAPVARFPFTFTLNNSQETRERLKKELLDTIAPLDRGVDASAEDKARIEKIAQELEKINPTKEPLKSPLISGKWRLVYTTSASILAAKRPKFLRPQGPIYQCIDASKLAAMNFETWPFFNKVTAELTPLSASKVKVKFLMFKILNLIPIRPPGRFQGELETTYLDEEMRISRGDLKNLFVLLMDDKDFRL